MEGILSLTNLLFLTHLPFDQVDKVLCFAGGQRSYSLAGNSACKGGIRMDVLAGLCSICLSMRYFHCAQPVLL